MQSGFVYIVGNGMEYPGFTLHIRVTCVQDPHLVLRWIEVEIVVQLLLDELHVDRVSSVTVVNVGQKRWVQVHTHAVAVFRRKLITQLVGHVGT